MLLTPVNAGHIIVGRPRTVLDLTGAVAAFFDANVESSLTLNNQAAGQTVSQWNDISGNISENNRHLTQPTAAAQPRLVRGRGNLLSYTQEFDDAYWVRASSPTVTANTHIAPDGTMTVDTIGDTSNSLFQGLTRVITVPNNNQTYTASIYVRKTTGGTSPTFGINVYLQGGTTPVASFFRLNTDTGASSPEAIVQNEGSYWRFSRTITNNNTGNTSFRFDIFPATSNHNGGSLDTAAGIGSAGTWGGMVNEGSIANEYIRRNALSFDGVDDRLFTNSFALNHPCCRYTVATRRNSSTDARHLVNSRLGSPNTALYTSAANNIVSTAGNNIVSTETFVEGQTSIFGEILNGANSSLISNGVVTSGNAGTQGIDGINIGSQNASAGFSRNDIHSHLLLNRLLTTEERLKLESYLGQRWGVPTWRTNAGALGNPWRYHDVQLVY